MFSEDYSTICSATAYQSSEVRCEEGGINLPRCEEGTSAQAYGFDIAMCEIEESSNEGSVGSVNRIRVSGGSNESRTSGPFKRSTTHDSVQEAYYPTSSVGSKNSKVLSEDDRPSWEDRQDQFSNFHDD